MANKFVQESIVELNPGASNVTQKEVQKQEKQIIAEVMMSAGPRKSEDSGLGEDACGFIWRSDLCFFWISDGTSESAILEDKSCKINFSSRTLAQELGEGFRREILNMSRVKEKITEKEKIIDKLLIASLDRVRDVWSEQLNRIQRDNKNYLDSVFSEDASKCIDFSSTFLCGVITTGGDLQVGCYGDSPFVVKAGNKTSIIRPENYRFYMRLNRESDIYCFKTSNKHPIESYCFENVSYVVAGSDGIGRLPEFVKALDDNFSFGRIRNLLVPYEPNTKDDKAICLLSLENY